MENEVETNLIRPIKLSMVLIPALTLLVLALLLNLAVAPQVKLLPADYRHVFNYSAESQLRESADQDWVPSQVSVRQVAQTLKVTGQVAIIQADLFWYRDSGELIFESTGIYGVDRASRMNLAGFGNTDRTGQFLFPPAIQRTAYTFWDAMFIGQRRAVFEDIVNLEGITVYRFHFTGTDMDETAGYESLPNVPEKYHVRTEGEGTLWLEPVTGLLVDYQESGTSYFVDPVSEQKMADFFTWKAAFTTETRQSQLLKARTGRFNSLMLEYWLPGALTFIAVIWLAVGGSILIRRHRLDKSQPDEWKVVYK